VDQAKSTTAFMIPTDVNPTEVLLTLDRELDHEVSLVLARLSNHAKGHDATWVDPNEEWMPK
jgi:hypothetical protein